MRALVPVITILAALGLAACGGRAPEPAPAKSASEVPVPKPAPASTPIPGDLAAALAAAKTDGHPVVVLVKDLGDAAGIDAAEWLANDAAARAALGDARLVAAAKNSPSFSDVKIGGSFFLLFGADGKPESVGTTPDGKPLAALPIPALRARLPSALAALRARQVESPADALMPRLLELLKAARASERDAAAAERGQADLGTLLAQSLTSEDAVQHGDDLSWLCRQLGTADQRKLLAQRLIEAAPRGRAIAAGLLDLADAAFADGDTDEAARCWTAAERAATGESRALTATARAMAALAVGPSSKARLAWEHRSVVDAVALVPDLPTYVATISRWRADTFFPVLFQDDRYAARFIDAFKPSRVIVVPSVGTKVVDEKSLYAALYSSWSGEAVADYLNLRARLRDLGFAPDGVVATQVDASEVAGALALAAGRFEGLEFVAAPSAEGKTFGPADQVERPVADAFAHRITEALARWPGADDGAWRAITLAGAYPYRYRGANVWGDTYSLDDLLGRDADELRVAAPGRLMGDQTRAAYQAMCSLFLQPTSALAFDTYDQNPRSEFGHHRLAPLPVAFEPRLRTDLAAGENIDRFRERVLPWNRYDAMVITSSGWPTQWSVPGTGTAEDVPVGVPFFAHMTHSGTAADAYNDDTIAGRALWGGAYFWFGASAEPFLEAFQSAAYSGRRIAAGAPLGLLWRERIGQFAPFPWRLLTIGDPLCCLRREPMRRVPAPAQLVPGAVELAADDAASPWSERLRHARWRGDRRGAQALMSEIPDAASLVPADLVIVLEECLLAGDCARAQAIWQEASPAARADVDARRYARLALGALMDQARARGDREALLTLFEAMLGTEPAGNFVERWIGAVEPLAKRDGAVEPLHAWLDAHAQNAPASVQSVLVNAAARIEIDRLLALPAWTETERDGALAALARLARTDMPVDQLAERLDLIVSACTKRLPGASADQVVDAVRQKAAEKDAGKLGDVVKAFELRKKYFRDWLLLGPFKHADHGAWEQLEAAAAAVDTDARWKDGEAERAWTRPFTADSYGFIDLVPLMDPHDDVQAYAVATILVDADAKGWLLLGSDDGVAAWLDGKQIHRNPAMRALTPDQDRVPVELPAGKHTLLLRIDQGGGGWAFSARLAADRDGHEDLGGVRLVNPLDAATSQKPAASSQKPEAASQEPAATTPP